MIFGYYLAHKSLHYIDKKLINFFKEFSEILPLKKPNPTMDYVTIIPNKNNLIKYKNFEISTNISYKNNIFNSLILPIIIILSIFIFIIIIYIIYKNIQNSV